MMHPNPIFRHKDNHKNIHFLKQRGFGSLIISTNTMPLVSHIPFLLSDGGDKIEAHLVRSNPILRQLESDQQALLAVSGPDAYISPDWYGIEDQVPTWNYVAVHVRGTLKRLPQEKLPGILERLSATFENRLLPKKQWVMDKMDQAALDKFMRMIVPVEMRIDEIDSTWKLSQNKPDVAVKGASEALATSDIGSEIDLLRQLMNQNEA